MPDPAPAIIFLFLPWQNVMPPKLAHIVSKITSLDLVAQTNSDKITIFEYFRLSLGTRKGKAEKKGLFACN